MKPEFLALLSALLLSVGCYNLDTDNFPTERPSENEVVGTYHLTEESAELAAKAGYDNFAATIDLAADGQLTLSNIPDWWNTPFGRSDGGYDSGNGRWSLVEWQHRWEIEFVIESRQNFHSDPGATGMTMGVPISGAGARPPFDIWLNVGDPDFGKVMIFRRPNHNQR